MTSCYYPSWVFSHIALAHYLLLEVFDIFILYLYVACINSSTEFSSLTNSLPHRARHALSPSYAGMVSWSVNCIFFAQRISMLYKPTYQIISSFACMVSATLEENSVTKSITKFGRGLTSLTVDFFSTHTRYVQIEGTSNHQRKFWRSMGKVNENSRERGY